MILSTASKDYDANNENVARSALRLADRENFKKGQDVRLGRGEKLLLGFLNAVTAHAGGGQGSATQLTAQISRVTVAATAADSVKLLPSDLGLFQVVINSGASAIQVFGTSPDTINAVATGTGVSLAAGKTGLYFCPVAGKFFGGALA